MTPGSWLFLGGWACLVAFISLATVRSGILLRTWAPPGNLMLSVPENLVRVGLVGVCFVLGEAFGPGGTALGWTSTHLALDLAAGAVAGIGLALFLNAAGKAAVRRWGPQVMSTRMLQSMLPASNLEWIGVLVCLLPAALLEELLFRSLPLGGLGWLVPPEWLLWPLALFFGLLHWSQGGWGVAGTALAAVVLSLLFLGSGSIWVPLTAHYAMNVHQFILAERSGMQPLRAQAPQGISAR